MLLEFFDSTGFIAKAMFLLFAALFDTVFSFSIPLSL